MRSPEKLASTLGFPVLMATLLAPAWACTSVPFCEQQPDKCVAGDEGESGGSDTSEDASSTEDTSGADSDGDSSGPLCGDGEVEGEEECDDANAIDGDGCDSDCTSTQVAAITLGGYHGCALIDGGRVRCWGLNDSGQLGYGNTDNVGDDELPSEVGDLPLPGTLTTLELGAYHSCALFEDDALRCWGANDYGQLGYGDTYDRGGTESIASLATIDAPAFTDIQPAFYHTCGLTEGGEVHCWGQGELGQLGYASVANMLLPGEAVSLGGAVARLIGGGEHACVILEDDGSLRCWGSNHYGQLGYGDTENIGDGELPDTAGPVPLLPESLSHVDIVDLVTGGPHNCALLSNGEVMCWGRNDYGQLGLGQFGNIGDDELPDSVPTVGIPGPAAQISLGFHHTCALLTSGEVTCWGRGDYGQLGYGDTNHVGNNELPEDVGFVDLDAKVLTIAAGGYHTCALLATREVRCWGRNDSGQLGLGHMDNIGDDELPLSEAPLSLL